MNPCAKFEFNWSRNEKVMEKPHFRWNEGLKSALKLEMTSYSGNTYDITNFFCFFKVLDLYFIPTKFHCCQTPNGRVKLGGGGFLPLCPL